MRITSRFSIEPTPLVLCLLLAIALWLYASMREEYNTVIDIPLEIRLPVGRALETETVPSIRAQVQGAGWQLVNHFLSSAIRCVVDVPEKKLELASAQNQALISISRQMLSQAIQAPVGVLVRRVLLDSLTLAVGTIAEKRVPIAAVLDVEPREGFVLTMPYRLSPDSITVRSSKVMLQKIRFWKTDEISLHDVYEPVIIETELSDTLSGIVQFQKTKVSCALNVQQMGEMLFEDVPVSIIGAPQQNKNKISLLPTRVSVLLRGGIEDIAKLTPEQVRVEADYNRLISVNTGSIKPSVYAPSGLQIVSVRPNSLHLKRRTE